MAKSPAPVKKDFQRPNVVFQPRARKGMQEGINHIVDVIRPTLGPLPRSVALERIAERDHLPEILDSGGTIVRRIIQVQGRDRDMGAMFVRHVLWELQEKVGDGTTSAAVMFQSIFNQGVRHIVTGGGNAMRLRTYLDRCIPVIHAQLDEMTTHLEGKENLARLAATIAHDEEMAKMMGEIFDIIGEYGRLEIRQGRTRELEREYVEGMYWDGGWYSRDMMTDANRMRADLEDAYLLISDLPINEPADLVPLFDLALQNKISKLLVMSTTFADRAMALLAANKDKLTVVAVKTPELAATRRQAALQDLAILTGGEALFAGAGDRLEKVRLKQLGRARRVWATREFFGVSGGRGDPRHLRTHIAELRRTYQNSSDKEAREVLLARIGKLMGGSATLWVGDISPTAIEQRKELAIRIAEAMRGAMHEGVVPGGGAALLACRAAIRPLLEQASEPDEVAAYRIVLKALEAPARVIWQNAGYDDVEIMADLRGSGPTWGFDVIRGQATDMASAGIWDAASVVKAAVHSAVAGAGLALTTDVLVHRKRPPESLNTA
jgi:chaperonin GroEL